MKLLLDSHILVWWMADDPRLGAERRHQIARAEVRFSPLSVWELEWRRLAGRLEIAARSLADDWIGQGFIELPLTSAHARAAIDLPNFHRDPVDRFLIAQARVEGLTLVTDDETIRRYPIPVL